MLREAPDFFPAPESKAPPTEAAHLRPRPQRAGYGRGRGEYGCVQRGQRAQGSRPTEDAGTRSHHDTHPQQEMMSSFESWKMKGRVQACTLPFLHGLPARSRQTGKCQKHVGGTRRKTSRAGQAGAAAHEMQRCSEALRAEVRAGVTAPPICPEPRTR